MNIHELDIDHRYSVTVRDSVRITPENAPEVRHIVLELPPNTPQYTEGQSIGVLVHGPHEFGNEYHMRLYSVASTRTGDDGSGTTLSICVRRCFYIDEVSGENYPGVASNYLCDRRPGESITITGPYGRHFSLPRDPRCNLLMIGIGTGIAPFRAFVRHIYQEHGGWQGKVRLFYGARTGMEMLYMNDERNDFSNYYDEATFKAFQAVSPRPAINDSPALDEEILHNREEIWPLIQDTHTHVYVTGQQKLIDNLDKVFASIAGGTDNWASHKKSLMESDRWMELLF
jgi:ferredoxin--NADP+ reductase